MTSNDFSNNCKENAMKKSIVIVFALFLVLISATWQSASASTGTEMIQAKNYIAAVNAAKVPKLIVNNKTGQNLTLTLDGPKYYTLVVPPGKTTFEVEQGKYTYSHYGCGTVAQTDVITVKKAGYTLKLTCAGNKKAGNAAKTPKLSVKNSAGTSVTLTLTGPKNYTFTVPNGKSNFEVEQGNYTYSYSACGAEQSGKVNVKKSGANLKITCPKAKSGGKAAKVTVDNRTGGWITLKLYGPQEYNFNLAPGTTKIEVAKGKYTYTVWGCGGASLSGTKKLNGSLIWKFWCTP
jgi:hypothetical protein